MPISIYQTLATTTTIALVSLGLVIYLTTSAHPQNIPYYHFSHRHMGKNKPYRIPLLDYGMPESHEVPGGFGVYLHTGASLEEHKAAVEASIDLNAHIRIIFRPELFPGHVVYAAYNVSYAGLEAMRGDFRVACVECDGTATVPPGEY